MEIIEKIIDQVKDGLGIDVGEAISNLNKEETPTETPEVEVLPTITATETPEENTSEIHSKRCPRFTIENQTPSITCVCNGRHTQEELYDLSMQK